MTNYSQRYASGDSNTAGAFYFDTITAVDYPAAKVLWGAEGAVNHCSASTPLPVTAVVTGTVTVGSHAVTNAGTFAVQVDGSALTALQLIDNLVLLEDAAHSTGDPGVQALSVRKDSAAATSGTDGDYQPLITSATGRLWVDASGVSLTVASHDVTNAGTFAVQSSQAGTWNITNVSGTISLPTGAATAAKQPALGTAGTASADVITIQGIASMTAVLVTGTGGTFPITDSGGSLTVDNGGTFAVQATVAAAATNIAKAEDAASADADVGVPAMAIRKATPANTSGLDGDYEMLQMSAGRLWVDASGVTLTVASHAVTNAGTFAVQIDGAALTSLQLIDDAVSGTGFNISQLNGVAVTMGNGASGTGVQRVTIANDSTGILAGVTTVTTVTTCSTVTTLTGSGVAHDAADSGNPHKIGAKATTSLSGVTLVADADRTDARSAADGALLVRDVCLEDVVQERTTNTDGASTAFTGGLAAPGAGLRLWITSVDICNSSASFCTVDLRDGAAGSVLWTLPVPATGGVVKRFDPPLKLTANTALAFDASAATTTLTISGNGFKSKL